MVNLARVKQIQERFDRATYLTVYTREAHPTESGDYIDYQYPVNDHKSLEDRLEAANQLLSLEMLPGPLLLDNMTDEASREVLALLTTTPRNWKPGWRIFTTINKKY